MSKNSKIEVKGTEIIIYKENEQDFISLTDIARFRDAERSDYILQNWMRNRSTIEFMGLWEQFNNPGFNSIEFDGIKNLSGANSFSLTPKRWIEATNEENLIPKELNKKQASMVYANEADLLNMALFGITAKLPYSN